MGTLWGILLALVALIGCVPEGGRAAKVACYHSRRSNTSIYNYTLQDVYQEEQVHLSSYTGNVVLLVNVATYWGLTRQYAGLNALQKDHSNFHVIGIPCNQFGMVSRPLTYWGLTRQYAGLNALQKDHSNFHVIGVPCNQFGMVSRQLTYWGLTRQYAGLNALQKDHSNFHVIGVPSNQFGMVSRPLAY